MDRTGEFQAVFERLRSYLAPHARDLVVSADEPGRYSLDFPPPPSHPMGVLAAAAQVGKSYVSYHLMPVYMYPELLDGLSDNLRRRMQGKSCFNFTRLDEPTFVERARLTRQGLERLAAEGLA